MNRPLGFLVTIILTTATISSAVPYISIRSQSVDSARELMGWTDKVNLYDMENLYIAGSLTLEGTRSFDADAIAHNLFGPYASLNDSSEVAIRVAGSQVPDRGATDWLADYFGLSTTYQGTLFFKPRVVNFIADFNVYVGLDEWLSGSYFRIHAPVVYAKWDLNFREEIDSTLALMGYDAGYFTPSAVPANDLVETAKEFFSDADFPTLPNDVTFAPLAFSRFPARSHQKTGLAEIQMAAGYNFISCEDYHLGLNFRFYAPTGNRPEYKFLFGPMIGNGKHWEVGVGYTGHYTFWESCDEDSSFGFYSDGNFTHLCSTNQIRSFDLVGKPNSRYMLAERLGTPVTNLFASPTQGSVDGATLPSAQFKGDYTPVANLTTLHVKASNAIQADIVALFNYSTCGLSVDIGYNFWGITCEKLVINEKVGPTALESGNVWALKGDARTYGYVAADAVIDDPGPGTPIALSATQSLATIHSGTNAPLGGDQNPGIDNAEYALVSTASPTDQIVVHEGDDGGPLTQQRTSNDPVFLSNANIDIARGRTKGLSNKIFAHISYTWQECGDIWPYIGVGGKAEFGPRHRERECNPNTCVVTPPIQTLGCNDCRGCAATNLSEWGIWIKGGLFWS